MTNVNGVKPMKTKVTLTDLAMNGATLHEIAAALGHKSLKNAERYTADVNNMLLTKAALRKRPRFSIHD